MSKDWTPRKAVEFAITTEELGERFYQRMAARLSDDEELSALFSQLAGDEDRHRAQFTQLLDSVETEHADRVEYERKQVLRAEALSAFFSRSAGPFKDADKITSAKDALAHTLAFEKAAVGFYEALRDVVGKHAALDSIIDAEKEHVRSVMKMMVTRGGPAAPKTDGRSALGGSAPARARHAITDEVRS